MKKTLRIICVLLILVFVTGLATSCSSSKSDKTVSVAGNSKKDRESKSTGNSIIDNSTDDENYDDQQSPIDNNPIVDNPSETTDNSFTADDFETMGYLFENDYGDSRYFLIVKNNSNAVVSVEGNATAKDQSGKAIGADNMSIDVLGPGETTIGYFYFDSVTGIDSVDYQLDYSLQKYYKPVIANLHIEQFSNEKNVTISVTNTGDINAQFVEAYALFFDSHGNIVNYESTYVTDNDSEIKCGTTLSAQLDIYGRSYDHVDVYFTGQSDGSRSEADEKVSVSDFTIEEHKLENYSDTMWFMVIKNNSEYDVMITVNSTAYDQEGNVVGADDTSIDVLGAGQTSLCNFYYDGVDNVDHIQCQWFFDTDLYYEDVIHNLEVNSTINDKNVIVSVSNHGSFPAEFVEAYALFFDSQGNLVDTDSAFIGDNDYEIKPDASFTEQLDSYQAFSSVEVYFTGRHSKH